MAGSAGDCTYWLRLLSATSKLAELETGAPPSARRNAEYLAGLLSRQPAGLDLSVGTMMFDDATLTYADNSGACLAGHLFAVGSGSPYAYSVLDAGYRADLSVEEAADLAEKAVRTAAARDAYSGGIVNVYFADKATGTWRRLRRLDDLP
jgi:20S proteasome subunit beta 5